MARVTGLCVCGGSRTQHTLDEDGCWCQACMTGPGDARCQTFSSAPPVDAPARVPRMRPSERKETSEIARRISRLRDGTRRKEVFILVQQQAHHGATDDELERLTGKPHQTVSATRNSLAADGLVIDSGERRPTLRGAPAIVWVVPGLPPKRQRLTNT